MVYSTFLEAIFTLFFSLNGKHTLGDEKGGWNVMKKSVKTPRTKENNTEVSTRNHNVIEETVAFIST